MRIAFVHNSKAFLPEAEAYTRYFSGLGYECGVISPAELRRIRPDVEWHFMGTDTGLKKNAAFVIHEYSSASMPPFADLKNKVKKFFNVKPDYRLFLNEYVKESFQFNDKVPYGYRDMGINKEWLNDVPAKKEYDFIYVGELRQGLEDLLDKLKGQKVLVVSNNYQKFQQENNGVAFVGPVPHAEVHNLIRKARFGINYMPDVAPFIWQTSTKVLEYCACKVPVVSSGYPWMWEFEEKYGGKYFFIDHDFSLEAVQNFNYEFPDLTEWTWEKQIEKSGIVEVLEKIRKGS